MDRFNSSLEKATERMSEFGDGNKEADHQPKEANIWEIWTES